MASRRSAPNGTCFVTPAVSHFPAILYRCRVPRMEHSRGTAIVVGAGIGGVTAAVALQRSGWEVTVLERADALGEVGAGISIWPGAAAVLAEFGVKGVEQVGALSGPMGLRRPSGRWLVGAADLGVELPVMIHRAQLHELITADVGS